MDTADFEDTVFLLNIRIRMVRDTIRLNLSSELFSDRCLDDIAFIDHVLAVLAQRITENAGKESPGGDAVLLDHAADTEWQFSQLLTEFMLESNSFLAKAKDKVALLRKSSNERRKALERLVMSAQGELSEQLVSHTELSILFGGT